MDTIAVHAHLLDLTAKEGVVAPDQWCHDIATGSVTYRFGSGPRTFTWPAPAVAEMVAGFDGEPSDQRARDLLERWEAISQLLERTDRVAPDRLLVDHEADEMTLVWDDPEVVMIIGPDDPSSR